jgi:hypothetical protein
MVGETRIEERLGSSEPAAPSRHIASATAGRPRRCAVWQLPGSAFGLFRFGRGVPEPKAQCRLGGSLVQLARLTTLAKSVLIGRLRAKAEVLDRPACEPLNLPRGGRLIALDVGDFEEAPMDLRSVDSLSPCDALSALTEIDARKASVIELRFFGGLRVEETVEC